MGDTTDLAFALQQNATQLLGGIPTWALTGILAVPAPVSRRRRWGTRDVVPYLLPQPAPSVVEQDETPLE